MGNLFKSIKTGESKIGKEYTCPICSKIFSKKSTYDDV